VILPEVKGDRTNDKKHRGGEPESKGFFRTGRGNSIELNGRLAEQSCIGPLPLPAAKLFDNQDIS